MIKNIKIRLFGKRYNVWKDEIDSTNKEGYYIYNNIIYYITGFIVFFVRRKKMYYMSKLTAVEWIQQQVKQQGITHYFSLKEILEQAKEMEKEQIKKAYMSALPYGLEYSHYDKYANKYYNDTYKKEEK
jgi:hypothetical protein